MSWVIALAYAAIIAAVIGMVIVVANKASDKKCKSDQCKDVNEKCQAVGSPCSGSPCKTGQTCQVNKQACPYKYTCKDSGGGGGGECTGNPCDDLNACDAGQTCMQSAYPDCSKVCSGGSDVGGDGCSKKWVSQGCETKVTQITDALTFLTTNIPRARFLVPNQPKILAALTTLDALVTGAQQEVSKVTAEAAAACKGDCEYFYCVCLSGISGICDIPIPGVGTIREGLMAVKEELTKDIASKGQDPKGMEGAIARGEELLVRGIDLVVALC